MLPAVFRSSMNHGAFLPYGLGKLNILEAARVRGNLCNSREALPPSAWHDWQARPAGSNNDPQQ